MTFLYPCNSMLIYFVQNGKGLYFSFRFGPCSAFHPQDVGRLNAGVVGSGSDSDIQLPG